MTLTLNNTYYFYAMRIELLTYAAVIFLIASIVSCNIAPDYPDEPVLEFVSFSKLSMVQGRTLNDSLFLTIKFTDGDGDIGSLSEVNLRIIDSRTGNNYSQYRVPKIPEQGANNGVSGTIKIKLFNTCCLQPDGDEVCEDVTVASNRLSLSIVMTDRAGNTSNTLTTPELLLECL